MSIWQDPKVQSCFAFMTVATLGQISDLTRPFSCMLSLAEVENVESAAAHSVFFFFCACRLSFTLVAGKTREKVRVVAMDRSWPLLY